MGKQAPSLVCAPGSSSGQKRKTTEDDDDWLSLGSAYGSAVAVAVVESTPTSLPHDSTDALPVDAILPPRSAMSVPARTGAASPVRFASLPVPPPLLLVAPSTSAVSLPAKCSSHCATRRRPNGTRQAVVGDGNPPPDAGGAHLANPAFPWATSRVAIHRSISELSERGIKTVEGEVRCRRCDARKIISYDVAAKFSEVRAFIWRNIHDMDDRAPAAWTSPAVPDCDSCGQRNSLRPVIPMEKEKINWVFLLLGQTLGLCTLDQLKHFCAHTRQHRTGAKDRVLYSTYMELCNQLSPDKLFNVTADRQKRGQHYS